MKYEFKPPFKVCKYSSHVDDSRGNFCFQFATYRTDKEKLLFQNIVNGVTPSFGMGMYKFNKDEGVITFDDKEIITIRGWGFLTGTGGLNLSGDEANEIQNKLGEYLTEKLNG